METLPNFKFSTENKILPQPTQVLCIIPIKDWNYLKDKVSRIKKHFKPFELGAPLFLGAGISGILTAIINNFTQASIIIKTVTWIFVASMFLFGLGLLFLARLQQKIEVNSPDNVLEYMGFMEEKFIEKDSSDNTIEPTNQ